jgi:thymidylate synthase ThyX
MIDDVLKNPAKPVYWAANKPGMQSGDELPPDIIFQAESAWGDAMHTNVLHAKKLLDLGVHKSIANRLLEPFMHMTTLVTATDFENFFALRAHPDAQPEFQVLAYVMLENYLNSNPVRKKWDEWHIPFSDRMPEGLEDKDKLKIATARAARLSYLTFEGVIDPEKDYHLHDRLAESGHMSPFEHAAQAKWGRYGNFAGWYQYRKQFTQENRSADLVKIWDNRSEQIKKFMRQLCQ